MQEVILFSGLPASGKSSLCSQYEKLGYKRINRDSIGGSIADLVPVVKASLKNGYSLVIDNLNCTLEERKLFIDVAKECKVQIHCKWFNTSIVDCQVNALNRMWSRYGKLFLHPDDLKEVKNDPNMFPITVLFTYEKKFVKPTMAEGFASVEEINFVRKPIEGYNKKALFLDYDDTLRTSTGEFKFPTKSSEIVILQKRAEMLKKYKADGYVLLGVSNQSGIARKQVTESAVIDCFDATNRQLGVDIDYAFCSHNVPPCCYCRKPQSGLVIWFMHEYKLDLRKCIFVGDQTSDKTTANRLGIKYSDANEFFC